MQNWGLEKLMGLDFSIEYKQGKENVVADTLSRQQPVGSLAAIFQVTSQLMMEAKDSWKQDHMLQKIVDKIRLCQQPYKQYTFDGQFLRRKGKVVIGANSAIITKILHHFHNSVIGGHSGDYLTLKTNSIGKGCRKR